MDSVDTKICTKCAKPKPLSEYADRKGKTRKPGAKHTQCMSCDSKIRRLRYNSIPAVKSRILLENKESFQRLREEVVLHYGNSCKCCGEKNLGLLTIHHVNNDGAEQRRELGQGKRFYQAIKRLGYPEDIEILCYNCNCCIGQYGYCSHKCTPLTQTCTGCNSVKSLFDFMEKDDGSRIDHCSGCWKLFLKTPYWKSLSTKERMPLHFKLNRRLVKSQVFTKLGGSCSCCGATDEHFLNLDHVQDNGSTHRKESGGSSLGVYRAVLKEGVPRDRYQLLCYNCNCSKGHLGCCPHKQQSTLLAA